MAQLDVKVTVNLKLLEKYEKAMRSNGPFRKKVLKLAIARYRAAMQERFDKFSRGGGNWPPFSPNTRRARGDIARASLLRDTNTLFRVLDPVGKKPGAIEREIDDGFQVGFGGSASHPNAPMTIGRLAAIHHLGKGVVPARELLDEPPPDVIREIEKDAAREHDRQFKKQTG